MADYMAKDGYLKAGYEYVHIDDCWMNMKRDTNQRLSHNQTRFPSGIPALAAYVNFETIKFVKYFRSII